jgi:GNAT superfamily N-acetyltransferase
MPEHSRLTVFPEVQGQRMWRQEVNEGINRRLSREERDLGPVCGLADGIYIVTVSANTPAERFKAAHLLNLASANERSTHGPGFVPTDHYDSAVAIVDRRVVGGVIAARNGACHLRVTLRTQSRPVSVRSECRPIVWDLWVHRAHRRKGLGGQLLEAIAAHFSRSVADLGHRLPISRKAVGLLRSMRIEEVLGRD